MMMMGDVVSLSQDLFICGKGGGFKVFYVIGRFLRWHSMVN